MLESDETSSDQAELQQRSLYRIAKDGDENELAEKLVLESKKIIAEHTSVSERYKVLMLIDTGAPIGTYDLDRINEALAKPEKPDKDILMMIVSGGGSIEPAYLISKLCRDKSASKFAVVIPRKAKSAATLVALGADEIHIGSLGELGPIDPQINGLPALGLSTALKTIASLAHEYPASADMFATYLQNVLRVEQIGYYERVSESAVQYAEILLSNKNDLPDRASEIANRLVYEYKDHGFVIDSTSASTMLGSSLVKTESDEIKFGEQLYEMWDDANRWLDYFKRHERRITWSGGIDTAGILIASN